MTMYRVLKPGGYVVFLTANLWDYASLIAAVVPNRFHPWIVSKTEGRAEHDVFPIAYRTNTRGAVEKWSRHAGFELLSFSYLGQYPSYFMFNGSCSFWPRVTKNSLAGFRASIFSKAGFW